MLRRCLSTAQQLVPRTFESLAEERGWVRDTQSLRSWACEALSRYIEEQPQHVSADETRGSGLFVAADVRAGEVLSLYPGLLFPPPPVDADATVRHSRLLGSKLACIPDDAFSIELCDGAILDATPSCIDQCCVLTRRVRRTNALAHMAARALAGAEPNALVVDIVGLLDARAEVNSLPKRVLAHVPSVPSEFSHGLPDGERVPLLATDPRRTPRPVLLLSTKDLACGDEIILG
mmetsp:Transcript_20273/g.54579  ORF Transcript_20273/g.54579 Transcript_20273/m.54579 type:complete len:234 (+) Transcript_20273:77-778(+)